MHTPQQRIRPCQISLSVCRDPEVVAAQIEHIGIIAEEAIIQFKARDRVHHRMPGGIALPMHRMHVQRIVPVQAHIAANAAVRGNTERRHQRNAAAENRMIPAALFQ